MKALDSIMKITYNERKQLFDKIDLLFQKTNIKLELLEEMMNLFKQETIEYINFPKENTNEMLLNEIKLMGKYNKKYEELIKIYYVKEKENLITKIK